MDKKSKSFRKQMETDLIERSSEIKEMDEGEDKANAEKNFADRLKAYAETQRAKGEIGRAIATGLGSVAALGMFFVELFKAINKNRTNEKIINHQVNLMENWEKNTFDNKG